MLWEKEDYIYDPKRRKAPPFSCVLRRGNKKSPFAAFFAGLVKWAEQTGFLAHDYDDGPVVIDNRSVLIATVFWFELLTREYVCTVNLTHSLSCELLIPWQNYYLVHNLTVASGGVCGVCMSLLEIEDSYDHECAGEKGYYVCPHCEQGRCQVMSFHSSLITWMMITNRHGDAWLPRDVQFLLCTLVAALEPLMGPPVVASHKKFYSC